MFQKKCVEGRGGVKLKPCSPATTRDPRLEMYNIVHE